MPRLENLGPSVSNWSIQTGESSSTHDVCTRCMYEIIESTYGQTARVVHERLTPYGRGEPSGEYGWGGNVAHPSYDDELYRCRVCKKVLVEYIDG